VVGGPDERIPFVLIWGFRSYLRQLAMLTLVCGGCHTPAAHGLRQRVTKFTLFFIPLFPISKRYQLQCTLCGRAYDIAKDQAEQLIAQANAVAGPPSPADQAAAQGYGPQGYGPQSPGAHGYGAPAQGYGVPGRPGNGAGPR
jgi:hypothetical protein